MDFWLASVDLHGEIDKLTCNVAGAETPQADGGPQRVADCVERIGTLLQVDTSALRTTQSADETLSSLLLDPIRGYICLIEQLSSNEATAMPLTPPVKTLCRSACLEKEIVLIGALQQSADARGNVPDEDVESLATLCRALSASSECLRRSYTANLLRRTVAPFWLACLMNPRGFAWNVNGESLVLCGFIGLCRLVVSAAMEEVETARVWSHGIACEVAATLVSTLIEQCAQIFLAMAEDARDKIQAEHATTAQREWLALVTFARRLTPALVTEHSFEMRVKPSLERLGSLLASLAAGSDGDVDTASQECCDRLVTPLSMEDLLDTSKRDASLLKQ